MTFLRHLGERLKNVLDWVDYRRDPSPLLLLAIPPMLSVTWAYGGWIGLGIVAAFATIVALLALGLSVVATITWIAGGAVADCLTSASLRTAFSIGADSRLNRRDDGLSRLYCSA